MCELLIRLAPRTAHRICDELSITQTATKLLIDDESVPVEVRSKIALIQSHTKHVAGIPRQFLGITGNREPPDAILDIREVLSQIESLIQRLLGDDIQLRMIVDSDLGPIKGDFDSLVQMFCALAANGRDAMPDGGIICIHASIRLARYWSALINTALMPCMAMTMGVFAWNGGGYSVTAFHRRIWFGSRQPCSHLMDAESLGEALEPRLAHQYVLRRRRPEG